MEAKYEQISDPVTPSPGDDGVPPWFLADEPPQVAS